MQQSSYSRSHSQISFQMFILFFPLKEFIIKNGNYYLFLCLTIMLKKVFANNKNSDFYKRPS